jgi:membrane associated rhomboid family serine protease
VQPKPNAELIGPVDYLVLKRFTPVLTLVALCWLVFGLNQLAWHGQLNQYGIIPRRLAGLPGIVWSPFLHGSFTHLVANTVPLLVLGGILCGRSKSEFVLTAAAGTVLGGGLTWLVARNACHIGASGLVFCFFGYLASLAYFRRTFGTLLLSLVCIVGYGGMLKGILPTATEVSWEGHLAGLVAGIALAWVTSKLIPLQKKLEIKSPGLATTLKR